MPSFTGTGPWRHTGHDVSRHAPYAPSDALEQLLQHTR